MSINERVLYAGINVGMVDQEGDAESGEQVQDIGLIVLLLASESLTDEEGPLVYTIIENKDKDATNRLKGQISVPAETRKRKEGRRGMLVGAIAEVTNSDDDLDHFQVLKEGFFEGAVFVNGDPASVAVLLYDGSVEKDMFPVDPNETTPNGWMRLSEAARLNGEVRPLAHDAFRLSKGINLYELTALDKRVPLRSVLPADFSTIGSFIKRRDRDRDVV